MSIEHRFPFSLMSESKHHLNYVKRVGDIEDCMDKTIGRSTIRIIGSVSANNYVEYSNLNLKGEFIYFQLKLLTKVATIHLEITTISGLSIRVSISTLYADESPRFFGRSLRYAFYYLSLLYMTFPFSKSIWKLYVKSYVSS